VTEIEIRGFPAAKAEVEALAGSFSPAWHTTLNREPLPAWFLARQGGSLVGFLTVFAPTAETVEVSAFVAPARRRQGVFTRLLSEARRVWGERRWLLVAERRGEGEKTALRLGTLAFTEATLFLPAAARPPFQGLPDGLTLEAGSDEVDALGSVLDRANGDDPGSHRAFLNHVVSDPSRRLVVLKQGDRPVGVGGLHQDGDSTGLFALGIDPDHQGKGWGRALVLGLLDLGAGGKEFVIDVDSTNDRAEKLYRSVGFTDRLVTDYYELPREAP
jgi:GNAT superfamily N-acetyltransferase